MRCEIGVVCASPFYVSCHWVWFPKKCRQIFMKSFRLFCLLLFAFLLTMSIRKDEKQTVQSNLPSISRVLYETHIHCTDLCRRKVSLSWQWLYCAVLSVQGIYAASMTQVPTEMTAGRLYAYSVQGDVPHSLVNGLKPGSNNQNKTTKPLDFFMFNLCCHHFRNNVLSAKQNVFI